MASGHTRGERRLTRYDFAYSKTIREPGDFILKIWSAL